MIHAGVGETHVNNILTSVDEPPVCHRLIKRKERRIGSTLEQCAKVSCDENLEREKSRSSLADGEQETPVNDSLGLLAEKLKINKCCLVEGYDLPDPDTWNGKAKPRTYLHTRMMLEMITEA